MEKIAIIIAIIVGLGVLLRLLIKPLKWGWRLLVRFLGGALCLWMLNLLSVWTGLLFPINPVTVLIAGFLGVPGVVLLALAQILM